MLAQKKAESADRRLNDKAPLNMSGFLSDGNDLMISRRRCPVKASIFHRASKNDDLGLVHGKRVEYNGSMSTDS